MSKYGRLLMAATAVLFVVLIGAVAGCDRARATGRDTVPPAVDEVIVFPTAQPPVERADDAIALALQFGAQRFKPVGGGIVAVLGSSAEKMTYADALDLLGTYAVATHNGANIIHLSDIDNQTAVWFVEVDAVWNDYDTDSESERIYAAVIAIPNGEIAAAGSSNVSFLKP